MSYIMMMMMMMMRGKKEGRKDNLPECIRSLYCVLGQGKIDR